MYSYKAKKFSVTFAVLYCIAISGEAFASPKSYLERSNINERIEYAISLNSIASTLMNWYGSLLTTNNLQAGNRNFNNTNIRFSSKNHSREEHRSTYPEQITGIQITNADLKKQDLPGQYQFEVEVLITFMQSKKYQTKVINEVFLFQISDSSRPEIRKITRLSSKPENDTTDSNPASAFQHEYYKSREIAYAWLAYMDGANSMGSQINIDHWLDSANYSVKIGSFELDERLVYSLQKRNQHLGKGGHLLRSVTANKIEGKPNHFELDLIIDWKGTTSDGKPSLAKINQLIQYKLQDDGSLMVLAINEKHLLPDMEPWQKLLC